MDDRTMIEARIQGKYEKDGKLTAAGFTLMPMHPDWIKEVNGKKTISSSMVLVYLSVVAGGVVAAVRHLESLGEEPYTSEEKIMEVFLAMISDQLAIKGYTRIEKRDKFPNRKN